VSSYHLLSLDETGKASYNHNSPLFILSGMIIPESIKNRVDAKMRALKMKFWSSFISIVNNPNISFIFVITNKQNAKKFSWQPKTILKRSYLKALEHFVLQLKKLNRKGKILVESDASQDLYLIQAHSRLQAIGTSNRKVLAGEYRSMVTSLSLVNKANFDIDVQIADALAPIAGVRYAKDFLKKKIFSDKVALMKTLYWPPR